MASRKSPGVRIETDFLLHDPRFLDKDSIARSLYLTMLAFARLEHCEFLPRYITSKVIIDASRLPEAASTRKRWQISLSLRSLMKGHSRLVAKLKSGRYRVIGVRKVWGSNYGWKDETAEATEWHTLTGEKLKGFGPNNPAERLQEGYSNPPLKGNHKGSLNGSHKGTPPVRSGTVRSDTKRKEDKSAEPAKPAASAPPPGLADLELYRKDQRLLKRWPELWSTWTSAYPYMDIMSEIRKAHAWEIANPAKRKKDRGRFLGAWLGRAQDRGTAAQKGGQVADPAFPRNEPKCVACGKPYKEPLDTRYGFQEWCGSEKCALEIHKRAAETRPIMQDRTEKVRSPAQKHFEAAKAELAKGMDAKGGKP